MNPLIIQILGVVAAISIVLALNMVARNYKWWLFYAATNMVFIMVQLVTKPRVYGLALMGLFLFITGIRNYFLGRKKVEKYCYESKNSIS